MNTKRPYLLLFIIILLWGFNFIISRFLSGIDPIRISGVLFALFRYSLGALTMIVVIVYQRMGSSAIRDELRLNRNLILLSALISAIFVIGMHTSTEFITSGTSAIIINLHPVVVLVFGVFFLKERLSLTKMVGFLLGLSGALIFLWTSITIVPGIEYGILLALVGAFAWAAYTITLHYLEGANRYVVMTVTLATSSMLLLSLIAVIIYQGFELILVVDVFTIAGLLISGVLGTGLAYILYFTVIEMIGPTRASSFLFLTPFVGVAGDFVLGEPPEFVILLAGLVALIGVALIRLSGLEDE